MNDLSQINVLKIVHNEQKMAYQSKWRLAYENAVLDTGRSLKQILIRCLFVPCVSSWQKELKMPLILVNTK